MSKEIIYLNFLKNGYVIKKIENMHKYIKIEDEIYKSLRNN